MQQYLEIFIRLERQEVIVGRLGVFRRSNSLTRKSDACYQVLKSAAIEVHRALIEFMCEKGKRKRLLQRKMRKVRGVIQNSK